MQPDHHPTLSVADVRRAARRVLSDWPGSLDRLLADYHREREPERPQPCTTLRGHVQLAIMRHMLDTYWLPTDDDDALAGLAVLLGFGGAA